MAHQMPQLQQLQKRGEQETIRPMAPRRFETENEGVDCESPTAQAHEKTPYEEK